MNDKGVYTKGNSFRALAEAHARKYRKEILSLVEYEKYGHILVSGDAEKGLNFLNQDIFEGVKKRRDRGKGVDWSRTSKNLLASQAMCFNLFVPLSKDKRFTVELLNSLLHLNAQEIIGEVQIEYTPPKEILNDQSGPAGVDCDTLIEYRTADNLTGIVVIETKYVEEEFSLCGFRKYNQKDKCPIDTAPDALGENCRYHSKKHYKYWNLTLESEIFDLDKITGVKCPFSGPLWQLWVNTVLAYGIAKAGGYDQFHFVVIAPKANIALSEKEVIWEQYRQLLKKDVFRPISLEVVINTMLEISPNVDWVKRFEQKYNLRKTIQEL